MLGERKSPQFPSAVFFANLNRIGFKPLGMQRKHGPRLHLNISRLRRSFSFRAEKASGFAAVRAGSTFR